jgi:hypothetical protein
MKLSELKNIIRTTIIEKKLCPKGKAYYNRRIAAGEVPSAYLSGRAVKVCKGLMEEDINPLTWEPIIKAESEEIERTAEDLGLPYDVVYDSFVNGKEVTLNDDMWSRLENTDSYDVNSEEEAVELAQYYGKDIQSILSAEKTPPALILQYSPNKFYLVGGNTRLMVARAKGVNPQVILATIEPLNKYAYQDVNDISESLRDWFKKEDWVRIDTQGNITGPCGTMKKGQATTRCLPRAKANSLTKAERAATARKKAAADRKGDRVVPNTPKAKVRLEEDCGCNGPKLILKEGQNVPVLSEGLKHHIAEGLQLIHNIYRPLSKQYFELFNEARKLYNEGLLSVTEDDIEILESNIGEMFTYKGVEFPLDYILTEEELVAEVDKKKTPPIGKPKRGGSKKFYVYVRKPGGGIKKVSFGDTTGLRAKLNNPQARRAFAARHDCKNKKDRTKASYWSCRLPRYAKLLGFKTTFSGYW